MKNAILATTSITALLGLSACSIFEKSSFDIEDERSQILTADERVLLNKDKTGPFPLPRQPEDRNYLGSQAERLVCAEPSPDAITAAAFSGQLGATVIGQGDGTFNFGYAESATSIAARTAAVQVLRDLQYRACEALINGVVGPQHYNQILAAAAYTTIGLVAVDGLGRAEMARPAPITAQTPPSGEPRTNGVVPTSQPSNPAGTSAQRETGAAGSGPGEMARALCLTTIASPAGVDARLRAAAQQSGNGNPVEPDYKHVGELVQTCMGNARTAVTSPGATTRGTTPPESPGQLEAMVQR